MKIPSEAQLVFKGIIFDVYQWQQKMFDGSFQTFEMLKRPDTIEVIATSGNKVLFSHQSQPTKPNFYSLFGGRAEPNEDQLQTAKRELKEEAGLESDQWQLYKISEPFHKLDWKIYTYIARNCKKVSTQSLDSGEKIEVLEKSFDEFIDFILSDAYWGTELTIEVLKLKCENRLDDFRKHLFG